MEIIEDIKKMQENAGKYRCQGKIIGFVPTMGFLHRGHLSLIRIARAKCDILVVSIFVNPTQFGENEDLDKYPRDFERDRRLCENEKVDVLFFPSTKQMYRDSFLTFVSVEKITRTLCGLSRPTHFRGVATVVCKLFNIVEPHFAVFGQKDYQQVLVIKRMAADLNFDLQILTGPIVREADGLALSSRNKYLSPRERKSATVLVQCLRIARKLVDEGERRSDKIKERLQKMIETTPHAVSDYIEIVDSENLQPVAEIKNNTLLALAVFIGKTRLIDNILLPV